VCVKTKPFAQNFTCVLSKQRRRLDVWRAPTEAHRPARHLERTCDRVLHRLHDAAPFEIRLLGQLHSIEDGPGRHAGAAEHAHRRHFGKHDDPVLVWRAPTRTMNPSVSQQVIDAATERDPASAAAEWLAEFRSDIESFINREAVEACITWDVRERAPMQSVRYYAFVDPSGGSADSMSLAIGHREDDSVVVDALREINPPFSPESVVGEFSALLKSYRVSKITGDRYAGEWPREHFRKHGITYEPAQKPKSDLYRDLLPVINSRKLDLLDRKSVV